MKFEASLVRPDDHPYSWKLQELFHHSRHLYSESFFKYFEAVGLWLVLGIFFTFQRNFCSRTSTPAKESFVSLPNFLWPWLMRVRRQRKIDDQPRFKKILPAYNFDLQNTHLVLLIFIHVSFFIYGFGIWWFFLRWFLPGKENLKLDLKKEDRQGRKAVKVCIYRLHSQSL